MLYHTYEKELLFDTEITLFLFNTEITLFLFSGSDILTNDFNLKESVFYDTQDLELHGSGVQ